MRSGFGAAQIGKADVVGHFVAGWVNDKNTLPSGVGLHRGIFFAKGDGGHETGWQGCAAGGRRWRGCARGNGRAGGGRRCACGWGGRSGALRPTHHHFAFHATVKGAKILEGSGAGEGVAENAAIRQGWRAGQDIIFKCDSMCRSVFVGPNDCIANIDGDFAGRKCKALDVNAGGRNGCGSRCGVMVRVVGRCVRVSGGVILCDACEG